MKPQKPMTNRERMLYLVIDIIACSIAAIFLFATIMQKAYPVRYNEWVERHPYVPFLVQVAIPEPTIGNNAMTDPMYVERYYGVFFDAKESCWRYLLDCYKGHVEIKNPTSTTIFYVETRGAVGAALIAPHPWSQCEILASDELHTVFKLGPGCTLKPSTLDPEGYIRVSNDPID